MNGPPRVTGFMKTCYYVRCTGMAQVKVENQSVFQDIASLTAVANSYSTTELLVESQCDIYIQKIGSNYSAYA